MKIKIFFLVFLITTIALQGCGTPPTPPQGTPTAINPPPASTTGGGTLTVMSHSSFNFTKEVMEKFEKDNNITIQFIKGDDAGTALNRAILTKNNSEADVFYGVDNTFLSRAIDEDLFEAYDSPMLKEIGDSFKIDPKNRALPIDYGDVCINYDKAYFKLKNLDTPKSLEDLTKPAYKGLLVVENPATSSPGLAFMFATIAHFGPDNYLDFWKQLRQNDLVVVNDWETAYNTNFSGSSGKGSQPMVVSYGSSPPVEVFFAAEKPKDAPTASIIGKDTCFRQIEFAGIIKGTKNRSLAEKFIDFLMSVPFQEDMPLQMYVFPVNTNAKLPELFTKYAEIPEQPATLTPEAIAKNRESWIKAWDEVVIR